MNKAKSKQIRLQFSGKFLVPHSSYISPKEKRFLVTGVNLVTEVEQPLTWFLAPVVVLVHLVIASSLDKPHPTPQPPGEKRLLFRWKKPRQLIFAEKNRSSERFDGSSSGACVLNNEPTPFILFLAMTVTTNTSDRPNVSLVHV